MMAKKSRRHDASSIKYRWISLDLPHLHTVDIPPSRDAQVDKYSHTKCDQKVVASSSSKIVTTPEFISGVGKLWKAVSQPQNVPQLKTGLEGGGNFQKENAVGSSGSEGAERTLIPLLSNSLLYDPKSIGYFSPTAESNYENLITVKRMILFDTCRESISRSFQGRTKANEFLKSLGFETMAGAAGLGVPHHLVTVFQKISGSPHLENRMSFTQTDYEVTSDNCNLETESVTNVSTAYSANILLNLSNHKGSSTGNSRENGCRESSVNLAYRRDSSEGNTDNRVENAKQSSTSLHAAYLLPLVTNIVEPMTISSCPNFNLCSNLSIESSPSIYCACKECQQSLDCHHLVSESSEESISKESDIQDSSKSLGSSRGCYTKSPPNLWVLAQNKIGAAFAKGKHALAGGLAGIFVSLFLHPIDTVKTVVQAHGVNQQPIFHTIESIISERGVLGLYRGIASNIASSAPTSAIYTFTYESVKGNLLPLIPEEYHSLAHCTAGGCASIATSFIFTPSERIKQQMQVHSHYQNCWNALIGVLEKGGLSSLYAGWGAVLCRNIPHSIIKFYTYERLKQLLQPSAEHDAHLNTLQTLVCGGLAGSTAALFTTPFDVVKTRLQAQVPGSLKKYDGVLHVLKEIAEHEGMRGLYRGLAPRLLMYVSQGAIFFASYEFLKTVFSFQGSELYARGMGKERDMEEDCGKKVT